MLLKRASKKEFLDALEKIKAGLGEIYRWADKHIVGDDIFPRDLPKELADIIAAASSSRDELDTETQSLDSEETQLMNRILVKGKRAEKLSEEEYYFCRAIGAIQPSSQNESEYEAYLKNFL